MDKDLDAVQRKVSSNDVQQVSQISVTEVGREHLSDALPPHETYEGRHRYDPGATWTEQEERRVVRKLIFFFRAGFVSWYVQIAPSSNCLKANQLQFFGLQLDRGNLSNETADNLLSDLGMTIGDYNNVSDFASKAKSGLISWSPGRELPSNFWHS